METSTTNEKIKRGKGRPKADTTVIFVRVPKEELAAVDAFIARQDEKLSRPQAIRRMAFGPLKAMKNSLQL